MTCIWISKTKKTREIAVKDEMAYVGVVHIKCQIDVTMVTTGRG